MIKETISPVRNKGAQMSQEEKPWFNHSQMIANIMSARMKELGMTQKMLAEKMNIQGILYFVYGFKRKILTPF